jgi:hypothetical protein
LSGTAPNLTYTPNAGYFGPDSFTYKANDGTVDSNVATASITVTPVSGTCTLTSPTLDVTVSADQKTAASKLVSPAITTGGGGELLLAFVQSDGPTAPTQQVKTITGGGLTWSLAARSNATWGTAEVWQAYATAKVSSVKVTATLAKSGWDGAITVAAFKGAASHVGAVGVNSGVSGMPTDVITPAGCNSLIWASGHDWTHNTTPIPAAGQVLVHSFVDGRIHDSFWTQRVTAPTTAASAVTVGDTMPIHDRWMMAAVEIPAAS